MRVAVGLLLLLRPVNASVGPAWARELATCQKHDETDSSIAQCQDWCKYPSQCEFCKCRSCSMCQACTSHEEGDLPYESCEDWCSVREHCSHCKCRACSVCQSCKPADKNDIDYEDCQPWCSGNPARMLCPARLSTLVRMCGIQARTARTPMADCICAALCFSHHSTPPHFRRPSNHPHSAPQYPSTPSLCPGGRRLPPGRSYALC